MAVYRLGSSALIYAPGIVAWAVNGGYFKKDRPKLAKAFIEGWGVPPAAALALVASEVPYKIEDDVVVFQYPKEAAQ